MNLRLLLRFFSITGWCVSASLAGVAVTSVSNVGTALFYAASASSTDLINAGQPTLSSATVSATFGAVFPGTGINDGNYTNTTTHNAFFQSGPQFPATATYSLNVSVNTLGYTLTSIKSFMGWQGFSSMAQGNQTYTIEYSVVGSALYSPLATVAYSPFTGDGTNFDSMVTVTDTGGTLASGVDSIRFTFADPGPSINNPGTVVREIDVIGSPTGGAPSALTIGSPAARHLVQRSAANTGSIAISGTFSGTPDRIEARAVVMAGTANSGTATAWQTIQASPVAGNYSGSLAGVPAGGWYQLEVRPVTGSTPGAVVVRDRVGVGDIYVTAGQSNSANYGASAGTPADDRVSTRTSVNAPTWRHGYDPQPLAGGGGGSVWSRLGDQLAAADNIPIGFVCVGVGATQVIEWVPGTNYYNNLLKPAIQSLGTAGFRAVLWHQGESDAIANVNATTHAARLNSMIVQSRTDAGWTVPWYLAEASFHPNTSLSQEEPVVAGQRLAIYGDANVFIGPSTDAFHLEDAAGGKLSDSVHFNAAGLLDHATQWRDILRGTTTATPRNGDFEDNRNPAITGLAALADGASQVVNISADLDSPSVLGWRILSASGQTAADGSNGFHNPSTGTYTGAVDTINGGVLPGMSGRHVAMLDGGTAANHFLHTTRALARPNSNHMLSVALGVRDDAATFGSARIEILANGQPVATATYDKAALDALRGGNSAGTFTPVSLNYQTVGIVAANQPLAIRITKVGGSGTVLDFDHVRFTAAPTGYSLFQIQYWGDSAAAASAQNGDPDRDGASNGIEYFLGTDPLTANPLPQATSLEMSGRRWSRYAVALNPAVTDTGLGLEYSYNLSAWSPAASSVDGSVMSVRQAGYWTLDIAHATHPRAFFRLSLGPIVPASP